MSLRSAIAFLGVALLAGCATSPRTFTYAAPGGHPLRVDLYFPKTPPPPAGWPLIVSIHGGGWLIGDRRKDVFLRDATSRGYALASIDYRLSREAIFPAQIDDAHAAMRWLVAHRSELRIDTRRVGVTGASAGGLLALLLALDRQHSPCEIRAVCALYPPTDLVAIVPTDRRDDRKNPVAALLGGPVSERLALANAASPINYASSDSPPVLLVHGSFDLVVPVSQSEMLHRRLRELGADSTLLILPGAWHAFCPHGATKKTIDDFFDANLKN